MSSIEKALERMGDDANKKLGDTRQSSEKHIVAIKDVLVANNMVTPDEPHSPLAEEFRGIKRPLLMNILGKGKPGIKNSNLILVTSALASEGKTFNSINLAVSIAMELDRTVLLVDADVRRPASSDFLGLINQKGLTDLLIDDGVNVSDVLVKTDIEKLNILPVGSKQSYTTELLTSGNMEDLVNELSKRYPDRVIILDSPPLLGTSEAGVLAHLTGQVVVVVEAERTTEDQLKDALTYVDKNAYIGLVLNKCLRQSTTYGYGDKYPIYER